MLITYGCEQWRKISTGTFSSSSSSSSQSLLLFLSLCHSITRTRTEPHTDTRTHTHTPACTHTHTHTHTRTLHKKHLERGSAGSTWQSSFAHSSIQKQHISLRNRKCIASTP